MIDHTLFITTDNTYAAANIAMEAYLLETVPKGCCILYLWQNAQTVVIGRNQNAWRECRVAQLEEDGGFLARRMSGGGAVYHDLGNLNFTFLVNTCDYDLDKQSEVIRCAVARLGLETVRTGRNDITVDGRKFSGNAFYEHNNKSYHHGTLLVDVDTSVMSRYLVPSSEKLQSKGVSSVRARVVNLKELNSDVTIDLMSRNMHAAFDEVYGIPSQPLRDDPIYQQMDVARLKELEERFASWEWRFGRKIPFTAQCGRRFDWGEVDLQLEVDSGHVKDALVYSDCMDAFTFEGICDRLIGKRFNANELSHALDGLADTSPVIRDLQGLIDEQDW